MVKKYATKTKKQRNVKKHQKPVKKQNKKKTRRTKKGGSKFGMPTQEYVLPERTYLYVGNMDDTFVLGTEIAKYNFEGKNVGVMSGCFCPPHVGHFQTIYDACVKNNLGVMFLKTINSENRPESTRHGLPSAFTIKMLHQFAKYINSKIGTEFYISTSEIPWDINTSMDHLFFIEVNEIDGEPTEADIERAKAIEQTNMLAGKARRFLENFDRENNTKVFNSVLFRNKQNGVSATSFVRSLMKILENPDDADAYAVSSEYLPSVIFTDEEKHAIIDDMLIEFGAYLK
jgi:hypothetical protein